MLLRWCVSLFSSPFVPPPKWGQWAERMLTVSGHHVRLDWPAEWVAKAVWTSMSVGREAHISSVPTTRHCLRPARLSPAQVHSPSRVLGSAHKGRPGAPLQSLEQWMVHSREGKKQQKGQGLGWNWQQVWRAGGQGLTSSLKFLKAATLSSTLSWFRGTSFKRSIICLKQNPTSPIWYNHHSHFISLNKRAS